MNKLIVCYMIENDEDVFELSYNSIKDVADEIVIVDGNRYVDRIIITPDEEYNDEEERKYIDADNVTIIYSPYPHEDLGADGKQRNKYLDACKENFLGDWVLVLDADEVIDHPEKIKQTIEYMEQNNIDCTSPKMRHLVGNLGQEDSTVKEHYVPNRLFKVTKDLFYPEVEHNVLQGVKNPVSGSGFVIWHLGYCREIFRLRKKFLNHSAKSNIHNPGFLEWWYHAHLFGEFPTSKVYHANIPKIIKDHFQVNDDYLYFKDRGADIKHAEMVRQWNLYFKPSSVLDLGCGRGAYLRFWESMVKQCCGMELSKWAVENKICESFVWNSNILDFHSNTHYDLVTCLDVLEHLDEKDLQTALKNVYESGETFLFSIPFEGDPNLYNDPTHKIFKSKEWWISELEKAGFKIKETPKDFYYAAQMVVCSK